MFIFHLLFVTLGIRYISHNHLTKPVCIHGSRMHKIMNTYDKVFVRTLPTHMVSLIDFDDMDDMDDMFTDMPMDPIVIYHDEDQELFIKKTLQSVFLGNDMRPRTPPEISEYRINELFFKRRQLTTLENPHVSLLTKLALCNEDGKPSRSNLYNGGLMDDYLFESFS